MPDAFALANAFVRIRPTDTGFRAEADAQIKTALAGLNPKVRIDAVTGPAMLAAKDLKDYLKTLTDRAYEIQLLADDKDAAAKVAAMRAQLAALTDRLYTMKFSEGNIVKMQAALLGLDAQLDKLRTKSGISFTDVINAGDAMTQMRRLKSMMAQVGLADFLDMDLRPGQIMTQLALLKSKIAAAGVSDTLAVGLNTSGITAQIAALEGSLTALPDQSVNITATGLEATTGDVQGFGRELAAVTTAEAAATASTRSLFGWWGLLTGALKVPLFGGIGPPILAGVGALHLLVDVAAEVVAVWLPALIALGAYGLAASDGFKQMFLQITNMHTVMDATGARLPEFSGDLERMHLAVQPQVYQLLGDALTIVNLKTGEFNRLASGTATVLDQLAARSTVAIASGGFETFLRNAVKDLSELGTSIGNIIGTIGNLLKELPGYAQDLLAVGVAVTHGLEVFTGTSVVQGILKTGLAVHGAVLYMGLLGTAASVLLGGFGRFPGVFKLAASAFTGIADKVAGLGKAGAVASIGLDSMAGGATTLATLPWGWIAAVGAGLAILVYQLLHAKDATQQWVAGLEAGIQAAKAVQGFTLLMQAQNMVAGQLALTNAQVSSSYADLGKYAQQAVANARGGLQQYKQEIKSSQDLSTAQQTLLDQSVLYTGRLTKLSVVFGGVGAAQGILTASGVTMNQMLDKGTHAWLMILQEVEATQAAYRAMGIQGGILGADLNALNIEASDQVTAMGNVNAAWDKLNTIVTGGQSGFIAFEQAFNALGPAAKAAGASMNGLGANSLTLRSDWQTLFTSGQSLLDALRMMTAVSPAASTSSFPMLTQATKDTIAQMIPLGKQSAATRAEMVYLAQQINPAVTNFQQLVKWLGNTANPAKNLQKIVAGLGVSIEDLSADATSLTNNMQSQMIQVFNKSLLSTSGLSAAIATLGKDVSNTHTPATTMLNDLGNVYNLMKTNKVPLETANADILLMASHIDAAGLSASQKHQALSILYNDFVAAGNSAKTSSDLVNTLGRDIGLLPPGKHIAISASLSGGGGINVSESGLINKATLESIRFSRAGWKVPGYGGGDKHMIMAEGGEAVVPKELTPMVAPLLAAYGVPGFQSGGFVGVEGQMAAMPGHLASAAGDAMHAVAIAAMKASAQAAVRVAANAVKAQTAGLLQPTGSGGSVEALMRSMAASIGWVGNQWTALYDVEMAEAGFNPRAQNPGSGAYGLAQFINGPSEYAQYGGNASTVAGQITGMFNYIRQRYIVPTNAWLHEQQYHWYSKGGMVMDAGGWIPPGASTVINRTGKPEHLTPGPTVVNLTFAPTGSSAFDKFMTDWVRKSVRTKGGGDVQVAFGTG